MELAYRTKRTAMQKTSQSSPSRRPDNTAYKQQQLPACRVQLTASRVLLCFFATGLSCLAMGIVLLLSAKGIQEVEINYTETCADCAALRENADNFDKECSCSIPFNIPQAMQGDVYMFYKLYGFYQNLYQYVLSRSNIQLVGTDVKTPSFSHTTSTRPKTSKSQCSIKELPGGQTRTVKPPSWSQPAYELDADTPENNGFTNDAFIVWMRTAAFPTFKKLYRRLHRTQHFTEGLPAGSYSLHITYNFPVTKFHGEKSVVLSTLTWSGGSSLFLGLAYTVTGAVTWLAFFSMMAVYVTMEKRI
ncbi:cell cycle control protein 50C-like isoform X3 [Erinaceus europaeus]|uniref:Cell cycle control protein n=1 Tax=Erinaceus europaeus TaxID=9365 RepID=A0ABM3VV25_ERIEU|nr:cell cycle control protein 50C-like isoform X3 [Erinaceus europaeus]